MTGKAHIAVAALTGGVLASKLELHPFYILICTAGGLFADTDIKQSYLGRFIPLWLFFRPHRRNFTHSIAGGVVFSLLFIVPSFIFMFFVGYMTHLLLDLFNKDGIPLLWPSKKMYSLARFKTGGWGELFIVFVYYIMMMTIMSYW